MHSSWSINTRRGVRRHRCPQSDAPRGAQSQYACGSSGGDGEDVTKVSPPDVAFRRQGLITIIGRVLKRGAHEKAESDSES